MPTPSHSPPLRSLLPSLPSLHIRTLAMDELDVIYALNLAIFEEQRIINAFDRRDLLMLLAEWEGVPVGFKIGYRENRYVFYSAKGGVLPAYRRRGVARHLLYEMIDRIRAQGFTRLAYDTFPNRHAGMAIFGFLEGFRLVKADYNAAYKDYRLRFEKKI